MESDIVSQRHRWWVACRRFVRGAALLGGMTLMNYAMAQSPATCVTEEAATPGVAIVVREITGGAFAVCGENTSFLPQQVRLDVLQAENLTFSSTLPFEIVLPAKAPARVLFTFSQTDPQKASLYEQRWTGYPGDPNTTPDEKFLYWFPFEHGTKRKVTQGYFGIFSHSAENSYALDFDMSIDTPVTAARGGMVAEVKADSDTGGPTPDYKDKSNYVKILHDDGTIGLYAHLKFNGVAVSPGEQVNAGQLIAYSGDTGFLSGPHLHFEVQQPRKAAMPASIPIHFRSPDGLPLQSEEGRYYYAAYKGRPAFRVRLGQDIKDEQLPVYESDPP